MTDRLPDFNILCFLDSVSCTGLFPRGLVPRGQRGSSCLPPTPRTDGRQGHHPEYRGGGSDQAGVAYL